MIRALAPKRLTSPSRTQLHADTKRSTGMSMKREAHSERLNNVVVSIDALKLTFEEEDSEIEISGPFPLPPKSGSSMAVESPRLKEKHAVVQQANAKPVHHFFRPQIQHRSNDSRDFPLKASSPPALKPRLETTASLNAIVTDISGKPGLNTLKNSDPVSDAITPPGAQLKDNLNLPVYSYKHYKPLPTVVYTQHEEETNDLIAGLKSGRKNTVSSTLLERRAAVVQVADSSGLILVIQIYSMTRFPIKLQSLLENSEIPKIGVNILNDGNKLFRDYGILAQNLVELGALALFADQAGSQQRSMSKRKIISLAKLVLWYCGMNLEKGNERTSNWELKLGKQQIDYAANDVHSSMIVYQKLCDIAQLNSITLANKNPMFTSNVKWPIPEKDQHWYQSYQNNMPADGQPLCAYQCWHHDKMSLDYMCTKLSLKKRHDQQDINLKPGTVISYIISALQADPSLPYSLPKLIKLVQMDIASWNHHREWIIYTWNQNLIH